MIFCYLAALHEKLHVPLVGKELRVDHRCNARITARQRDGPAAERSQHIDMTGNPMTNMHLAGMVVERWPGQRSIADPALERRAPSE